MSSNKVTLGSAVAKYQIKLLRQSGDRKETIHKNFSEILESKTLVNSLLESNTFFHAKLGFHEKIYTPLIANSTDYKIIHTLKQFPKTTSYDRLVIIPRTASSSELNSLIAKALNIEIPIWLIAPFPLISSSILLNFQNFFITFHKKSDFEEMLSLFDFSTASELINQWAEEKLRQWKDSDSLESVAVFITNHPSFLSEKENIVLYELQL